MRNVARLLGFAAAAALCLAPARTGSAGPAEAQLEPMLPAGSATAVGDGAGSGRAEGPGVAKAGAVRVRARRLARLDVEPLRAEDARLRREAPERREWRVGVVRDFPELRAPRRLLRTPDAAVLPSGERVFTLEVESPGARGMRLHVSRCELPAGAELVCYDAEEPAEAYGTWTARGPRGTGEFWTPTVFAERVRLELRVPAASAGRRLKLAVDRVTHNYEDLDARSTATPSGAVFKEGACHNDVVCDATYASGAAHAVARIGIVSFSGSYVCSGSLLSDSEPASQVPWFLTANHCVSTSGEAASLECFWDYYATTCGGTAPSLSTVPRTVGATLMAASSATDVSLVRLTGTLPSGRYFAGWTGATPTVGGSVVSVHHPQGTPMRISYASLVASGSQYHDVLWSSGVTEPGSSGSPLFNSAGQVIGQLCCGSSSCSNPTGRDSYGRFDYSFPLLAPYLVDYREPVVGPPPGGGGGGGGGGPIVPAPVGPPLEFYTHAWQRALLEHGEYQQWDMHLFRPSYQTSRRLLLKVKVKGRKGAWARLVDPQGQEFLIPRGKGEVEDPRQGEWRIELHSAEDSRAKVHKIRIAPNY